MYFRHFSTKIVRNTAEYGTTEETSYPVIAIQTLGTKKSGSSAISDPDNTYVLIANDSFKLRWIALSDCEQVDLT